MNVRNYYAGKCICEYLGQKTYMCSKKFGSIELGQDKAQAIIDEITKAYERVGQSGKKNDFLYIKFEVKLFIILFF